jgi:peptidyl-dipeptidase Dcp
MLAFSAVTGANLDPTLQKVQRRSTPKLAAHSDAIFSTKLFQRVKTIYDKRATLKLDAESLRLVDYLRKFVHSGPNLSEADKVELEAERRGPPLTQGSRESCWPPRKTLPS